MGVIDFDKYKEKKREKIMCMHIVEEVWNKRNYGHSYELPEIREVAKDIINDMGVQKGPIPIIKIAEKMGFSVYQLSMEKELSGFIAIGEDVEETYGDNKVIGVNADDDAKHQRFVIAHELGHFIFDYNPQRDASYYDTYKKNAHKTLKEKQANNFSANLLMPPKDFIVEFSTGISIEENIDKLASYFQVQKKAVYKRLIEVAFNGETV